MKNKAEFSLEKTDEMFKKSAWRYSLICIAAVIVCFFAAEHMISAEMKVEFDLFDTVAIDPAVVIEGHDVESSGNVTVGVSGYRVEDRKIYVSIFGKNNTDQVFNASSGVFILSSFNKASAEPRYHYYAENWQDVSVPAKCSYNCELIYDVSDVINKINDDYIFTLSAFRNVLDRETVEIVINNQ